MAAVRVQRSRRTTDRRDLLKGIAIEVPTMPALPAPNIAGSEEIFRNDEQRAQELGMKNTHSSIPTDFR